ncbi:MAG: hypothetical protein R3F65_06145 [bacterium]
MARGVWTAAVAAWLCLAGCEADPVPLPDPGEDGAGGFDLAFDMRPVDMRPPADGPLDRDVTPTDVGDLDMGALDAEADGAVDAAVDMAPDMEGDEGVGPAVDPPGFEVTAVTRRGQDTFFVWVDAEGRLVQLPVDGAGRQGAVEEIELPGPTPTRVVADEADGHPWVAFGAPDIPIVLYQPDLPEVTRIIFDDLFGEPLITAAEDGVLVFGETEDGTLAWRRVSNELEVGERTVDALGIERPTDAAEVPVGAVLLLGDAEQCIELRRGDWQATTSFVCAGARARVVSNGRRALISQQYTFGNSQRIGLRPLYGKADPLRVAGLAFAQGLELPMDGPRRPVMGLNPQARTFVSVIGSDEVWDTVESWDDFLSSPFVRVRAMAQRALPARRVDPPADGGAAAPAAWLLALDFRSDGAPRVRVLPLALRQPGLDLEIDDNCLPRAEVCNLTDEDCDSFVNNGLCCNGVRPTVSYRWAVGGNQSVAQIPGPDGTPRYEFLVADVENGDAYRAVYRVEGTYRWEGKTFLLSQAGEAAPRELGVSFDGAVDGRMLLGAGGTHALIARRAPVEGADQPGGYAVFFKNQSDNNPAQPRLKASVDLDCSTILAADVLDHSLPVNGVGGEQIVVVCPDRIMRIHANNGIMNAVFPVEMLVGPRLGWATILRSAEDELQILVGYEFGGGEGWNVARFEIDSNGRPTRFGQPGGVLNLLTGFAANNPIYIQPLHPIESRPPVQIIDERYVRVPFAETTPEGQTQVEWREARLAPQPTRTEHVRRNDGHQLFSAGPYVDAMGNQVTGWWVIELRGTDDPFNLWAPAPAFTIADPVAHWAVSKGPYDGDPPNPLLYEHPIVIITSSDGGTGRNWLLRTRQASCALP